MRIFYNSLFSFLKKPVAILSFVSLISLSSNAQVSNYAFSQVLGTYTPITGGTVLASGTGFWDDNVFGPIPIGFPFIYNTVSYTDVMVAANGYVKFGTAFPGCCWYNGTSIANETDAVHIFSEDLLGDIPTCEISYLTTGTPGSQVFTIQWKDWGFYFTTSDEINFQLKLYEGTNVIEFAYSPGVVVSGFQTCQVGLTGTTTADFNSRTTSTDWTATIASTTNADQVWFNTGVFPPSGLSYFWTLAPIDMTPVSLVTPVVNSCYSATETVTIRIQNVGSQLIDFSTNPVTVACTSTATNPQTFPPVIVNTGTLPPSGTQDVVITTTYDMSVSGNYTFTASVSVSGDGNPANDVMAPVTLPVFPPVSATANPSTVCQGQPTQLSTPPGNTTYTVTPTTFAPLPCTGTTVTLFDDQITPPIPIGFTFDFFGQSKTDFHISSNGFISFDPAAGNGCCTGQLLPDPFGPNDLIALAWEDMYPPGGGTISYYTTGTAPFRKLVVCYTTIGHFFDGNNPIDGQIILNESSNTIELHITSFNTDGDGVGETQGIENFDGSLAFTVPGRNSTDPWSATNEAWLFTPLAPYTFVWSPSTWLSSSTIYNPVLTPLAVGNFTYTVTATDPFSGCTSTSSVTVTVVAVPSAPIASNVSRCGFGTVQLSATAVGSGTLEWYDEAIGGNLIGTGSPITSPFLTTADTFYVHEFDGVCPGPRTPVIVTITTADSITTTTSQTIICGLPASTVVTLTATSSNPGYNYTWTGADLITTTGPSVTAQPTATTTYVVLGDDGTCAAYDSIQVILSVPPPANATVTPTSICLGSSAQLNTPQATFQIGNGTLTNTPFTYPAPFGNWWTGDRNQNLILASELVAAGMNAGPINSVEFFIQTVNIPALGTYTNFTVSMGTTAITSMTNTFVTGLTQVFTAASILPVVGWNVLTFSTPFVWDGVSNLVIETTFMQCATCPGTPCVNFTTNCIHELTATSFNSTIDTHADFNCGITTAPTGTTYQMRPNMRFGGSSLQYLWTPNTYLDSDTIFNPLSTPTVAGNYTYTVLVTDPYGCTSTSSVTFNAVNVPVAPAVTNLTRCGTGTVTLSATAAGPGTLQWFDVPTGGTPFATGSPVTSPVISFTDTFYVEEFDGNCSGPRTPLIVIVTPADTIITTPTSNPMCAGQPITITISSVNPGYSYTWTPVIGLSNPAEDTVTANPPFTTLYTITAIDAAGCETSTSINLIVNPSPVITSTSSDPAGVCLGSSAQLMANVVIPPDSYIVASIPYAPLACPATPAPLVQTTGWPAGDEGLTAPLPLGFNFNFFGNNYSSVSISSNGHLQFTPYPLLSTFAPFNPLPFFDPFGFDPDNIIAALWSDYDQSAGGTVTYGTIGSSPNQQFVVCYTGIPVFPTVPSDGDTITCQVILNESDNSIEVHVLYANPGFFSSVIGIENSTGTAAFTPPNRNTAQWTITTPEAWKFSPAIPYTFTWTPSATLDNDTIVNPVATPTTTTTYTISVFDAFYNCASTATVTVNVNPLPVVTFPPLASICIDGAPFALSSGTPTGGTYTGPGVSVNIFYPMVAGVGTHTIVYTYIDNLGCVGSDSTTIVVNDLPIVTLPTYPIVCVNATPINLTTGLPIGGSYSGPGVSANIFNPSIPGTGIHSITYTYTDGNGCVNSAVRNVTVIDAPVANAGPDTVGNITLVGSATGGTPPYTYNWTPCLDLLNCNTSSPFANPQVNTYYILYVIDANGCYSTDTVLVTSTIGIAKVPAQGADLLVYPNPASGLFNILFLDPSGEADVTIVNYIGQVVFSSGEFAATSLPYEINFENQPDGIYTIQVKYREKVFTTRLVLNK